MQIRICNKVTVCFLVDKITPSADTLRQNNTRSDAIRDTKEINLMDQTEYHNADHTADDTAVNCKSAPADRLKTEPILKGFDIRIERAIIYARAYNAER